jgi:hypothetical protein
LHSLLVGLIFNEREIGRVFGQGTHGEGIGADAIEPEDPIDLVQPLCTVVVCVD